MKILLVGEYSGLHNSLKEGLITLGHEVVLISTGDYFKKYPSDILLQRKYDSGISKKVKVLIHKLFKKDISSIAIKNQFFKHKNKLKGFDVVQLINESPFGIAPEEEIEILNYLFKNNKRAFLLSCGTDYISVSYALTDKLPYTILKAYKEKTAPLDHFQFALKYCEPEYKKLHDFVVSNCNGILASDMDYHIPLLEHPKYLGLVPNPINTNRISKIEQPPLPPITIFLGINRSNYHTKGIHYFEAALEKIKEVYTEEVVQIKVVENLPYKEYIKAYDSAHIILDQVLGMDQGYNALEAMAKGKVVFTGAEKEWLNYYNLEPDTIAINAVPDKTILFNKLVDLIENPSKIESIGLRARTFIEKEHNWKDIAQKYLDHWTNNPL